MNKAILILTLLFEVVIGKGFLFGQHLMHYASEDYNYSMLLPEDWKRNDNVKNPKVSLVLVSPTGAAVSVSNYTNQETYTNGSAEGTIKEEQLEGLRSKFREQFIEGHISAYSKSLDEFQLQEKGTILARDDEADYLVFTYTKEKTPMREKVCFFMKEIHVAIISAKQEDVLFHKSLPVFDKIFVSFTFETEQDKVEKVD